MLTHAARFAKWKREGSRKSESFETIVIAAVPTSYRQGEVSIIPGEEQFSKSGQKVLRNLVYNTGPCYTTNIKIPVMEQVCVHVPELFRVIGVALINNLK